MSVNIAETFELLFDKNNSVAYKALQELQKESILSSLHKADTSVYEDSMRPLVYKDIQKALKEIQKF